MAEAKLMEGKVEGYSAKNGGIKIGDSWYNVSNKDTQIPDNLKTGCTVKFKWSKGKNSRGQVGNQIRTKVIVTEEAPKYSGKKGGYSKGGYQDDPKKQECIVRQNCLTNAVALVTAKSGAKATPEEMAKEAVKIAKELFLPFSYGPYLNESKPSAPESKDEEMEDDIEDFDEDMDSDEEDFEDDMPF